MLSAGDEISAIHTITPLWMRNMIPFWAMLIPIYLTHAENILVIVTTGIATSLTLLLIAKKYFRKYNYKIIDFGFEWCAYNLGLVFFVYLTCLNIDNIKFFIAYLFVPTIMASIYIMLDKTLLANVLDKSNKITHD
ncbi:MAG: hypothetical protein R8G33_02595 [Gammaproteobacteria bacterium]|nr:hypothetical protein [Gammaproteobacteria bacterium]